MLDIVPPEARLRARADRYARWSGLAAGAVVAQQLATMDGTGLGVTFLYALAGFGLCAVGGVLLGDALTPRPREAVRTADLAPRRVRDHVPPRMTRLLLLQTASLVVLLVTAAAVASPDDLGRAGRAFTVTCGGVTEGHGPWPGSHYGIPILTSLAAGTVACAWALRRIAHRPGGEQQRRDRSSAITAAWGLLVSAQLLGVIVTITGALTSTACDGTVGTVATWLLYSLGLLALPTLAWSLLTVVSPRGARG
ncbi:hypothetical protein [Streptomyces halobius]|uniref:ABC-2 family transporter n=1 Tax=Streptomyces halobius TaxID=2879846 RepID=A0ABY4M9F3_9ACTN|nr:hypothetical protein [Streptomyces halobius]UQA94415.1 hypothetical protein K9S39_23410 [Streptomyces halobius]